ncbi:carboxylesterase/lipase family protein [Devosia sp. CAU 1758]
MSDGIVQVPSGRATYRGLRDERGDRFLGIPYAEPPLGERRFRPPVALDNAGLVDATDYRFAPPQAIRKAPAWAPQGDGFETGEDCLNLNVYTPAADERRRPVIVHAFGGGFQSGAAQGGNLDEAGFAHRGDVVLVRPNMRVGALGFLHLGEAFGPDYAAANRGMLDLIAALHWVHDNIAAFGGDPDNVTLVGMSSGAFTISALFGVDDLAHLYRRVWLMSGPASRIIAPETATALAADFLERSGVAPGDEHALRTLPVETILTVQDQVLATHLGERNAPGGRTFGIVLDGTSLQRHPLDAIASGRFRDHQVVAGWTRDEARMWYAFGMMPVVETRQALLASLARFGAATAEASLDALEAQRPGLGFTEYEEIFLSRAIYRDPALKTLETHAAAGGMGFAYEFSWVPGFEGGRLGAAHGLDEPFAFGDLARVPLAMGDETAAALAATMSRSLLAFARTGNAQWPAFGEPQAIRHFGETDSNWVSAPP